MATTIHSQEQQPVQLEGPWLTDRLDGVGGGPRDPLELLDYRTRRHLITMSDGDPGPHLAFESAAGMYLFRLAKGATTVGRALGAQIRLDDCHISRRHVTLTYDGERTQLVDSRSLNGTWVNGERVVVAALHSGDLVEIGPLVARYLELQ